MTFSRYAFPALPCDHAAHCATQEGFRDDMSTVGGSDTCCHIPAAKAAPPPACAYVEGIRLFAYRPYPQLWSESWAESPATLISAPKSTTRAFVIHCPPLRIIKYGRTKHLVSCFRTCCRLGSLLLGMVAACLQLFSLPDWRQTPCRRPDINDLCKGLARS